MRRFAVALALALAVAACAEPSGVLDDYVAPSVDTGHSADLGRAVGAAIPERGDTVVEEQCVSALDDRCGAVLVDQSTAEDGPPSRLAVHFRIRRPDAPGRPVLLLTGVQAPSLSIDDLDLPGRPLIELTRRGAFPSTPQVTCPEMSWLPPNPTHDDWGRVIAACAARLRAAGVDPGVYDTSHRAADAAAAIALLGYDDVDVIAPGQAALDLGSLGPTGAPWVHRVLQVQPAAGGSTRPAAADLDATARVLERAWQLCDESATCATHGTVDEFLAVIATFAADPIRLPPHGDDPTGIDRVVDDVDWLDRVVGDAGDESAALFLPELHLALRDRDTARLARYLDGSSGTAVADGFTSYCDGWAGLETEPAPVDALFARWVDDTRGFVRTFCDGWGTATTPGTTRERWPGALSVVADAGFGATPEALGGEGEVLVTPTIAEPPVDCVVAAAARWFEDGAITDDPSCDRPPTIVRRDSPFELVDGFYDYDLDGRRLVVRTVVPDTWADHGAGTWGRDADPLDLTTLDLYVLPDLAPRAARDWFVDGWELEGPIHDEREVGDRTWSLVTAADPWNSDQHYRAGFAVDGDLALGFVLWATPSELDALTETVLVPALDAARLDD